MGSPLGTMGSSTEFVPKVALGWMEPTRRNHSSRLYMLPAGTGRPRGAGGGAGPAARGGGPGPGGIPEPTPGRGKTLDIQINKITDF